MAIAHLNQQHQPTDLQSLVGRLEATGSIWARVIFPRAFSAPFAAHHLAAWDWAWAIVPGVRPRPFVEMWGRGGAKTQTAQGVAVSLGARQVRSYCLVVSAIQDQADEKVSEMASLLEDSIVGDIYPGMGERAVGKYGHSKGWRRNRIRTASGFTVDALGLDTSARGKKVDSTRPDIIIIDDVDDAEASVTLTEKNIRQITRKILPTATKDAVIIGAQNLVRPDGFFGRMAPDAEFPADYLADRILSGPLPGLLNPTYEEVPSPGGGLMWTVSGGEPTWPGGQSLEACRDFIATYGLSAFRAEVQHEPMMLRGGLYDHLTYTRLPRAAFDARRASGLRLVKVSTWLDPAISSKDISDCQAIQCDALGSDGVIYRLFSHEQRMTPVAAVSKALQVAEQYGGSYIGVETDQGGDTWQSVYREAQTATGIRHVTLRTEKAGSIGSKVERGQTWQLRGYETGRFVHVEGTHHVLESALNRFPKYKPWDLHDAAAWSARDQLAGAPATIAEPEGRIPRLLSSRR